MKTRELKQKRNEDLIEMRKEAEGMIIRSYGSVNPAIKPEQRKVPRKLIAKINTILKEREK